MRGHKLQLSAVQIDVASELPLPTGEFDWLRRSESDAGFDETVVNIRRLSICWLKQFMCLRLTLELISPVFKFEIFDPTELADIIGHECEI